MSNLGGLYRDQGRYGEAEPLYRRALAVVEQALGPDHSRMAAPLGGLAALYYAQGRYRDAEPFYRRTLVIRSAMGPDPRALASTLNDPATSIARRALSGGRATLPPRHRHP